MTELSAPQAVPSAQPEAQAKTAHPKARTGYDTAYDNSQAQSTGMYLSEDDAPEDITPPELSNTYRFIRKLGEGTQGKVFEAPRPSNGQKVPKTKSLTSITTQTHYASNQYTFL